VRRFAASALLFAIGALGCAKGPPPPTGKAAAFELTDLKGGTVSLASLSGKVVVLDFWATWCGPCIKEMPDYAEFYRKNQSRGVEVLGIVLDSGEPQDIEDFLRDNRTPYRQLLGTEKVRNDYGSVDGFPTTFLVDAQGQVRLTIVGATPGKFKMLQETVDALLAGRS